MYIVSTRVKGPQGALSLPDRGYRTEPNPEALAKLDADARQQYYEIHSAPSHKMTVDMKVFQKRGSSMVSRDGQIVPQK